MTLEEILQDIHGLDARLQELEQQYGLLSEDLYTLYRLGELEQSRDCLLYTSPSPRDGLLSRMPSSA